LNYFIFCICWQSLQFIYTKVPYTVMFSTAPRCWKYITIDRHATGIDNGYHNIILLSYYFPKSFTLVETSSLTPRNDIWRHSSFIPLEASLHFLRFHSLFQFLWTDIYVTKTTCSCGFSSAEKPDFGNFAVRHPHCVCKHKTRCRW
jgi:hypothetical protein